MAAVRMMPPAAIAGGLVVNREGDELGRIEHLMIGLPEGRIAYAVLARGGVLGLGERLIAVPWPAFARDEAARCFVIDISPERLDAAPAFDHDSWPAMGDREWALEVHRHYGLELA
jgi:sporulation protein YlmC with PRC-barrel domain